jgi:hypothetical protein
LQVVTQTLIRRLDLAGHCEIALRQCQAPPRSLAVS